MKSKQIKNIDYIERTLVLSLDEAKKMYLAGGDLKKLALRVYTEKELHPIPYTWEEYCKNAYGKFYYINNGRINDFTLAPNIGGLDKIAAGEMLPSKEFAEAVLAYKKLLILRNAWIGDWTPDWNKSVPCIVLVNNEIRAEEYTLALHPLSFPTLEKAEKFLDCFIDLLKTAKNLY